MNSYDRRAREVVSKRKEDADQISFSQGSGVQHSDTAVGHLYGYYRKSLIYGFNLQDIYENEAILCALLYWEG